MFAQGRGVLKDDAQAALWYRKAAEQGIAQAQYNYGLLSASGAKSLPRDEAGAITWIRLAAEQGLAEAQCSLGARYATARGVARDYVEAYKWLRIASVLGSGPSAEECIQARNTVAGKMSPSDVAEAHMLAQEWLAAFEKRKR